MFDNKVLHYNFIFINKEIRLEKIKCNILGEFVLMGEH